MLTIGLRRGINAPCVLCAVAVLLALCFASLVAPSLVIDRASVERDAGGFSGAHGHSGARLDLDR